MDSAVWCRELWAENNIIIIININTINIIWNISIRNWFSYLCFCSFGFGSLFVTIFNLELYWLCGVQWVYYNVRYMVNAPFFDWSVWWLCSVLLYICIYIWSLSLTISIFCVFVVFILWLIQVDCAYKFNLTIFRIINSPRQSSISIDLFRFCCFAQ